jgi:hypothetical protein
VVGEESHSRRFRCERRAALFNRRLKSEALGDFWRPLRMFERLDATVECLERSIG